MKGLIRAVLRNYMHRQQFLCATNPVAPLGIQDIKIFIPRSLVQIHLRLQRVNDGVLEIKMLFDDGFSM